MPASTANQTPQTLPVAEGPGQAKLNHSAGGSDSASVAKRLSSELMQLLMQPPDGCSAFPAEDSDLTFWKGRIDGAEGTVYATQTYAISLSFPPTYPYAPPTVKFETPCFHPNVALTGDICLDILKEKWSPALSVSTILVSLQSLLGEPNNRSPLNVDAADLWDDPVAFKKELLKHYRPIDDE